MNIFFIDYETTGLNPYHNEPIEIAIKQIDNDKYYQSLITPSFNGINYGYIPQKITELTGIKDKDIQNNSKDILRVTYEVIQYIEENNKEGPIYILAHNGLTFDFIFFKKMIYNYNNSEGIKTRKKTLNNDIINRINYIDTLLVSRLLLRDESVKQSNLCKKYNIKNDSEHRSLGDIIALEQIYKILCKHLSFQQKKNDENYYLNNPEELIKETVY